MRLKNQGQVKFRYFLEAHNMTVLDFHSSTGIPVRTLYALHRADRTPSLALAYAIEDATEGEVKARDWVTALPAKG